MNGSFTVVVKETRTTLRLKNCVRNNVPNKKNEKMRTFVHSQKSLGHAELFFQDSFTTPTHNSANRSCMEAAGAIATTLSPKQSAKANVLTERNEGTLTFAN